MDEDLKRAIYFANKALDEPSADPDDDLRTVSRQFLRALERIDALTIKPPSRQITNNTFVLGLEE